MLIGKSGRLPKPDPDKEKKLQNEIEAAGGLEKNDMLAMILGAFWTFLPPILLFFLVVAGLVWLLCR